MTQHVPTRQLRFYMTSVAPCPYLPGKTKRKVFANLPFSDGAHVNDELTNAGFRRSQNIAYRPACEACDACVSVRLPVPEFDFSRSQRKLLNRNADLSRSLVEAEATTEQFQLLRRYLTTRHPTGGMSDMGWLDYVAMVEDTAVRVGDHRVLRAARPQPARNPHERAVQELRRPAAGDLDLRHVGQVEEARRGPDRGVLREIRPVAQRHEPATERDHAGSE